MAAALHPSLTVHAALVSPSSYEGRHPCVRLGAFEGLRPRAARAQDLRLAPMLDALRASGRQVFLATNSLWDYTHIVMNFLLHGRTGAARNHDWLEYFDVVITGAPAPPGRRRKARQRRPHLYMRRELGRAQACAGRRRPMH
jgi:hypothetical protein